MVYCYLCLNEYAGLTETFCPKCKRIKHHLSLNGDRVYEVLDNVLCRTPAQQQNKLNIEIKKEIENKEYNLRSGKKKESTN
jgi:hypothetical protein